MLPWIPGGERCEQYVLTELKRWLLEQGDYEINKRNTLFKITELEVAWSDLVTGRTKVAKEEPKAEEKGEQND